MHEVWITAIAEPINLPEFMLGVPVARHPLSDIGFHLPEEADAPFVGPIRSGRTSVRAVNTEGKADPIWDTQFTTRFSRQPEEEIVVPAGRAQVFARFLERTQAVTPEQEIEFLAATQHQEIATTLEEFRANGIAAVALDKEESPLDIGEADPVDGIVYTPSPTHMAAMSRRIEWERFKTCNGNPKQGYVEKCRWGIGPNDTVGILYEGPERNPQAVLTKKREFKYRWIEQFGGMPSVEELKQVADSVRATQGLPVLARMTEQERAAYEKSRKFGDEDRDPGRIAFHADPSDPKPNFEDYDDDEINQFLADRDEWLSRQTEIGYAGPEGMLGLAGDANPE